MTLLNLSNPESCGVRQSIFDDISAITPLDTIEDTDIVRALKWIASGAPIWRIAKPATPPLHLIAYFVIISGDYVLLGDHRNSGRWLPGGGHVEPGELPAITVARECIEEFCMRANFIRDRPFMVSFVDTVGLTAGHTDVCLWYALQADREIPVCFDSGEYSQVHWFPTGEIQGIETDPALKRALTKLGLYGDPQIA